MAVGIERKFLVDRSLLPPLSDGVRLRQGYLCSRPDRSVRVRIGGVPGLAGGQGCDRGYSQTGFEYPVPLADAEQIIALCRPRVLEKTRCRLRIGAHDWEVDLFEGDNAGLAVAEIELACDDEPFERPWPRWAGDNHADAKEQ